MQNICFVLFKETLKDVIREMPLCQSLTVSIKIAVIFIATSYSFH